MDRIIEFIIRVLEAIGAILGVILEAIAEAFGDWYYYHKDRVPYYIFRVVLFLICCGTIQWALWYIKCLFQNLLG